jgi:photosystem II stability/assembly factor-like uncharacterized protein
MATKSYYVGNGSLVKRLDSINLTGAQPWINLSTNFASSPAASPLSYGTGVPLKDVMTSWTNGAKVFVVGQAYPSATFKGISLSTDSGLTWITPGISANVVTAINSVENFTFYEVWVVDDNYVYACGSNGYVIKSSDGGLNFDTVTRIPIGGDVYSIHFINPTTGVVGLNGYIYKTTDGGVTWLTQGGGYLTIAPDIIGGIYMSDDQSTIVAVSVVSVIRSSDGGASFNIQYNFQRNGRHLTWYRQPSNSVTFWATGDHNEIILSTNNGVTWSSVPGHAYNLSSPDNYLAAHFYTVTNGFIGASPTQPFITLRVGVTDIVPIDQPVGAKSIEAVWTNVINNQCFLLSTCDPASEGLEIITDTNLTQYLGLVVNVTDVDGLPLGCFLVGQANCQNPTTVVVVSDYPDCVSCNERCYELVNCADNNDILTVFNPIFEDYIYQSVVLTTCVNKCYFVRRGLCTGATIMPDDIIASNYSTCNQCLGVVPPNLELHSRRIKPGFYTPGCPPDYTTKVNCMFAEQYYDEMAAVRYGISICCDHDVDKWDIKKQLLELDALYDPDLCTSTITPCDAPCNVTGQIVWNQTVEYVPPDPPAPTCPMPQPDPVISLSFE